MRQWTSQNSLNEHGPELAKMRDRVYDLILKSDEAEGISNHEIAEALQIPTATVSGLTRPLVLEKKVRELKKRKCKITGNTVIAWTTKPKEDPRPRDLFGNVVPLKF